MAVASLKRSTLKLFSKYNSMLAGNPAFVPGDYELISTTVLSSTTASVSFSGLGTSAAAYKHLELRYVAKTGSGDLIDPIRIRFNSDTGSNYSFHYLLKTDTRGVISEGAASQTSGMAGWLAQNQNTSSFASGAVSILDAFSATKNKTIRSLSGFINTAESFKYMISHNSAAWYSTAAVTSITLFPEASGHSFSIGSRFSLYGLRA